MGLFIATRCDAEAEGIHYFSNAHKAWGIYHPGYSDDIIKVPGETHAPIPWLLGSKTKFTRGDRTL